MSLPRRRRSSAIAALAVVPALLSGCSTDDGSGGATNADGDPEAEAPQGTVTSSPDPDEDALDPEVTDGEDPAQDPGVPVDELEFATCESDGFTVGYPDTWSVADGEEGQPCAAFGPGQLGAADRSDLSVPIQLYVDPSTDFEDQPDPTEAERSRQELTIDGQRAVRIEAVTLGEGGAPDDIAVTSYRVDLGDQGLLTATTSDLGETDYERDQEILDRMIEELRIG